MLLTHPPFHLVDIFILHYGTIVVVAGPGDTTCITPAPLPMHLHVLFTAGFPPTSTVGEPGAQGAAITGMHGIGVSTPRAAAVAAATCGFAREVHIPNGMMFTMGTLSMMQAAGILLHKTFPAGSTFSADGAIPKLHMSCAPDVTMIDTFDLLSF